MKNLWQVLRGIFIGLVSVGLVLGGISLSLAEGQLGNINTATLTPSLTSTSSPTETVTSQPSQTQTDTFTPTLPSTTPTLPPPPTNCPPPAGWMAYTIRTGDTLESLAIRFRTSTTALKQANCLSTSELNTGAIVYVPPLPTQTRIPCGPPSGWITTIIQVGDTLYRISQAYGVTVAQLQSANCMGYSTLLQVGQVFYVPPWAPHTPTPTFPGLTPPDTGIPTDTTPLVVTDTPTDIYVPPTDTPSEIPTS